MAFKLGLILLLVGDMERLARLEVGDTAITRNNGGVEDTLS